MGALTRANQEIGVPRFSMRAYSVSREGQSKDLRLVFGACTALFFLNLAWLLWVQHSHPEVLKSFVLYPRFAQVKRLLLQPLSLLALVAVLASWIIAFFRSTRRRGNKRYGLVFLALVLSTIFGLVLFFIFVA